jgi:hypothetical protein
MAYEFAAASSKYLSMTSSPVSGPPLTLACWFNASQTTTSDYLVSVSAAANNYFALAIFGANAGDPVGAFDFGGGGTIFAYTTAGYTANTWNHAAGVWTGLNNRTAYINGGNSGTNLNSQAAITLTRSQIGANAVVATNRMNGLIAEVGIWNAALTAAEIASLAKGMTCDKIRPQSLVFYAPLVRDLIDQKGGLTITNNNGATVANHPRVYA